MEISGSAFNAGFSGIQAGQRRVDQAASDIVSNTVAQQQSVEASSQQRISPSQQTRANSPADLPESLVELAQGRNEVQASARVVETADEVLGTLIDTRV